MSEKEISEILQKAKNDPVIKRYLFDQLRKIKNPTNWLDVLIKFDMYNPKYNPLPSINNEGYIHIPVWDELYYLVHLCENENLNEKVIRKILNILNNILNYKTNDGLRIENSRTDWIIIKILSNIPNYITKEHANYIAIALTSKTDNSIISAEITNNLLPKIIGIKNKEILLNLLESILKYKKIEYKVLEDHEFYDVKPLMGEFWFSQMISENKEEIFDICGVDLLEICEKIINEAIQKKDSPFTIITIEDSTQNLHESYEVVIISLIRDLFLHHGPKTIQEIISRYFIHQNIIFTRIALFIINNFYTELSEIFWKINYNPLLKFDIKHELWEFFNNNTKDFDEKQINIILDWIEHDQYFIPKEVQEGFPTQDEVWAILKKEWLLSIIDSEIEEVQTRYKKYNSINPDNVDHPGTNVWISGVVSVPHAKPFEETIMEKANSEIVEYLNQLEPTEKLSLLRSMEPRKSFKLTVQNNPLKFTTDISYFKELNSHYFYEYIFGLYDAFKAGENFPWKGLFSLLHEVTDNDKFWLIEGEDNQYKGWIIQRTADLIGEGCKNDDHSFDPTFMDNAEQILLKLDEICDVKIEYDEKIMDRVINSQKGSIYDAMLQYSRRYSRLHENEWASGIKNRIIELLSDPKKTSYELHFIMGRFLALLFFIDRGWVTDNLDVIFHKTQEQLWYSSFIGYLSGYRTSFNDLYRMLRESSNYKKGLETEFTEGMYETILISHIGVAFLNDLEKLDDDTGLIYQIINVCKKSHISSLITFVHRSRKDFEPGHKEKIIELWKQLVTNLLKKDIQESKELLAQLVYWFELIDEIDEETLVIMKVSAKNVTHGYSSYELIDSLLRFVDTQPKYTGELFLESLSSSKLPFIRENNINTLLTKLYESSERDLADRIYGVFMKNGYFFVKDVYERFH